MTLAGPLDGDAFAAYARARLVPTLRPGASGWCDNLSVHTRADSRLLLEAAGCERRFVPASSPDCNPIALVFSTVKERFRRLAARTQEALEAAIAEALAGVSVEDALAFFRHCGYRLADQ
jgi:transposase